jgi:hypothetical protein
MRELKIKYLNLSPCGDDLRVGVDHPLNPTSHSAVIRFR